MASTFDLLTLAVLTDVGPRRATALCARGPLEAVLAHPDDHADVLPAEARQELRSGAARKRAQEELKLAEQRGVRIVGLDEEDYPVLLKHIYDPPPVLYVQGGVAGQSRMTWRGALERSRAEADIRGRAQRLTHICTTWSR